MEEEAPTWDQWKKTKQNKASEQEPKRWVWILRDDHASETISYRSQKALLQDSSGIFNKA